MDTLESLLHNALDIGEGLLESGAEVYRVEDTVRRILSAGGIAKPNVFVIPSLIVATVETEGKDPVTQTRRILKTETDLEKLRRLNELSREICANPLPQETIREKILDIENRCRKYPVWLHIPVYMMTAFAFAVFFGGKWQDGIASAIGSLLICGVIRLMEKVSHSIVLTDLAAAAAAAGSALLCTQFGLGIHVDKIIIGNIMLLIPGIELTNGMRDLFSGDILSGLLHLGEAIFLAAIIALGAAFILSLGGAV